MTPLLTACTLLNHMVLKAYFVIILNALHSISYAGAAILLLQVKEWVCAAIIGYYYSNHSVLLSFLMQYR